MDIASVLEEYLADITTLPGDVSFILDEIKVKDEKLVEIQRRIQQRDGPIQNFVKTNGASQEFPKEQSIYPRIRSDFQECVALQQEKTRLAVMGLYLVVKHVSKLDTNVAKLEAEGLLAPVVPELDDSLYSASVSPEPTSHRPRKSMSESTSRRISRPDSSRDRTPASLDSRNHSRSASAVPANTPNTHSSNGSGSAAGSQTVSSSSASNTANGAAGTNGGNEDGQRQALEVNGARLSLKRNYQSPRQRPLGIEERDEAFCFCKRGSVGNMIACDGASCEIEWFHWECVGLTEDPKGSWYCPQCSEKIKKQAK